MVGSLNKKGEERELSLIQIARVEGVAVLLQTLEKHPTVLSMAFINRNIVDVAPNEFVKGSVFSLFSQILDKINNAREDWQYGIDLRGYVMSFDAYGILEREIRSTSEIYRYILKGYFSQNDYERFQRLVAYLNLLIVWWERNVESAEDIITHNADKGDGWMMTKEELQSFVGIIDNCHNY